MGGACDDEKGGVTTYDYVFSGIITDQSLGINQKIKITCITQILDYLNHNTFF